MNNISAQMLEFSSREEQSMVLARIVAARLRAAIKLKGQATLVVSGGSTPVPMFEALAQLQLNWEKVTVLLADERQVADTHHDSNTRLVRQHLLKAEASNAISLPLWNDTLTPEENLDATTLRLKELADPFNVVILGMGNDGHTASLFPCADKESLKHSLDRSSNKDCALMYPTTAPHGRITLTLPRLLRAEQLVLHITGQEKQDVLKTAFTDDNISHMPIRAFLRQEHNPIHVFWAE